jgi:hypothetical protein
MAPRMKAMKVTTRLERNLSTRELASNCSPLQTRCYYMEHYDVRVIPSKDFTIINQPWHHSDSWDNHYRGDSFSSKQHRGDHNLSFRFVPNAAVASIIASLWKSQQKLVSNSPGS